MRHTFLLSSFLMVALCQSCTQGSGQKNDQFTPTSVRENILQTDDNKLIDPTGHTIQTRFLPPEGFERIAAENATFPDYLRSLPLKPHNTPVSYYDGRTKANNDVYDAVVDLKIGNRDLHQCADAIMRLRAEYLWKQKQYDKIHFQFTNGFRVDYSEWMKGKRIRTNGNSTYWLKTANPSNTYADLWKYLETIFAYAGTLSLSRELKTVSKNDLSIGDIFIQGGSPGHAVIVVDMVSEKKTGKKLFLLAQSYMPAQEIQILRNPSDTKNSPWYSTDLDGRLKTPEWTFKEIRIVRFD